MEIWKEIAVDWQLGSPSIGKQLDAAWVAQSDEPGTQSTVIVSTIFFWVLFGRTAKPRWSLRSLPALVELQKSQQTLQQLSATPAPDTKASSSLAALEQERAEIDSKAIWVRVPVTLHVKFIFDFCICAFFQVVREIIKIYKSEMESLEAFLETLPDAAAHIEEKRMQKEQEDWTTSYAAAAAFLDERCFPLELHTAAQDPMEAISDAMQAARATIANHTGNSAVFLAAANFRCPQAIPKEHLADSLVFLSKYLSAVQPSAAVLLAAEFVEQKETRMSWNAQLFHTCEEIEVF